MTPNPKLRLGAALMVTASSLSLATPAFAAHILFSSKGDTQPQIGERVNQIAGLKQVRLDDGAVVSVLDTADYRINADGTVDLYVGSVTVAGGDATTIVRMPDGVEGRVTGRGSAASFSVAADGGARGHVLTGQAFIGRADALRRFGTGEMFAVAPGRKPELVVSNGAQTTPDASDDAAQVADMAAGGPAAAAQNGVPVTLGDALAAAGASSDILAAARRVDAAVANPAIERFPSGDLARLVAAAGGLERAYGGTPFPAAQADIIRTYLGWLASGRGGADFLTAYAGFLGQYLDLIRSGAAPSRFERASLADINAFLAYAARSGRLAELGARDRTLVDAYLAFLRGGGDPDRFGQGFTELTQAYFAFIRGGGAPADFTQASAATLDAYIRFLSDSGLAEALSAADRALLAAYLDKGGLAFAGQYRNALDAYFAWLASGRLPSGYAALDAATLRAYLETLSSAGLLTTLAGDKAQFYAAYLAFLQGGGAPDAFAGLPANVFAGYASQLDAYFAFLAAGNLPSAYSGADLAQLQAWLAQLQAAGALDRFLGERADFFAAYLAFLQGGGQADAFAGLNANVFTGYAQALAAYYDYLARGGVPSGYTALTQAQIRAYLAALDSAGASGAFLDSLADFYAGYFAFVAGGGDPDLFAGLPVPPDYPAFAAALNAYAAFLAGGGLPADYDAQSLATLRAYLSAIAAAGQTGDLLGANAGLLDAYFAYLAGGGAPNGFAGLPVYADYVAALNAYYAYLAGGGLPTGYAALTQAQINAYLAALDAAGGFASHASLNAFFAQYYAFVRAGGDPLKYAALPVYSDYLAAVQAWYAFILGGGRPSDYTALTPEQVETYLALLGDAGVLQAQLSDTTLVFLTDYLAWLGTGADPDQFAGLPINTPPDPQYNSVPQPPRLAYAGGFNPATAAVNFVTTLNVGNGQTVPGSEAGFTTTAYALDGDGGLTSYTRAGGVTRTRGTTTVTDISGNADIVIGRWSDGVSTGANPFTLSAAQGFHYLLARPVDAGFALPAQGVIAYDLLAATRPTMVDGSLPAGGFAGDMAIVLGAAPKVAFDATVTMPGLVGQPDRTFRYATAGGVTDPTQSQTALTLASGGSFRILVPGVAGADCQTTNCQFDASGVFAGNANQLGLTYAAHNDLGSAKAAIGAAIFGNGTLSGGPPPEPTFVTANLLSSEARLSSTYDAYTIHPINLSVTSSPNANQGYEIDASGAIVGVRTIGTYGGYDRIGTATHADSGASDSGVLQWTRWTGGLLDMRRNAGTGGRGPVTLSDNQGYHFIVGAPATNLPASGRVDYQLVGGTRPTQGYGAAAPGTLVSGAAAVQFGTQAKVGIDLVFDYNSDRFTARTAGGLANLSASELSLSNGAFYAIGANGNVTSTGGTCTTSCRAIWSGFLAGPAGKEMGLEYVVQLGTSTNEVIGVAAFEAQPAPTFSTGEYTNQYVLNVTYARTNDSAYNSKVTYDANGMVTQWTRSNGSPVGVLPEHRGPAEESGSVNGVIGWARWLDVNNIGAGNPKLPNSGNPILTGTLASALPTSGGVEYQLIGQTRPVDRAGNLEPGTFTGNLAVDFATKKVGFDFAVAIDQYGWEVRTAGGAANPANGGQNLLGLDRTAFEGAPMISGTTAASCTVSCSSDVRGALFGPGASHVGLGYAIKDGSLAVSGVATFAAQPPAPPVP